MSEKARILTVRINRVVGVTAYSNRFELVIDGYPREGFENSKKLVLIVEWGTLPYLARAIWSAYKERRKRITDEFDFYHKALTNEWE